MKHLSKVLFVFLLLFLAGPAQAALPPLDDSSRNRSANQVVRGEVLAVYSRKVKKKADFIDLELVVKIRLTDVTKGSLAIDTVIYASCWTIEERPQMWVGDGGQRPVPRTGDEGLFYLKTSADGVHRLLHPNGWDRD